MKNQDMPVNILRGANGLVFTEDDFECGALEGVLMGETKREKAFWQIYSAMLSHPETEGSTYDITAEFAIEAVDAGFKALGSDND